MMGSISRSAVSATRRSLRSAAATRISASATAVSVASSSKTTILSPTSSTSSFSTSCRRHDLASPPTAGGAPPPPDFPVHIIDGKMKTDRKALKARSNPAYQKPAEQIARHKLALARKAEVKKAQDVAQWGFLSPERQAILEQSLEGLTKDTPLPEWIEQEHKIAGGFRRARSRLWTPTYIEGVGSDPQQIQDWISAEVEKLQEPRKQPQSEEDRKDRVLKTLWLSYTEEQRENAAIECGFTCVRKLGWRYGYSSGYPLAANDPQSSQQKELIEASKTKDAAGQAALVALQSMDEDRAWSEWISLTPAQRRAEEDAVWAGRDRSLLFIDDSPVSTVLGSPMPRWFEVPQRAGQLVFLPNYRIRMVPNFTPKGKDYDVWKATFRVPHSVHKHDLRSFLLAVYGLRTTWIRTMVYRTRITRENFSGSWHRASRRNYKKAEVGLLEPFLFPKMSERFASRFMHKDTNLVEMSRQQFRTRGWRRWRSGHLPPAPKRDPTVDALEPKKTAQRYSTTPDGKISVTEVKQWDPTGRAVEERGGMIRSKKRSSIVKKIAEARAARMESVREKMQSLKINQGKTQESSTKQE